MKRLQLTMASLLMVAVACSFLGAAPRAEAAMPYNGYTWSTDGRDVRSINGYVFEEAWDGFMLGTGSLSGPEDIYIASDDSIYVADTGNNRILALNRRGDVVRTYGDEEGIGRLNGPRGVYVKEDGTLYVADTGNGRIVLFDSDGEFAEQLTAPDSTLLGEGFLYAPTKVIVDKRGYLYVTSSGNTLGLLQLDATGDFKGFYGANHIGFSWKRLLLRLFATTDQRAQLAKERPLGFSNLVQDQEGYIYTTTLGTAFNQIKRLSPVGVDTLNGGGSRRYGEPYSSGTLDMPTFVDVTVDDKGVITAIDLQTGKLFQYDKLGNLLFVFGGTGGQNGLFVSPSSVAQSSDGRVYVVDKERNTISRFRPTPFADLVHEASAYYVEGQYAQAHELWRQVLKLNGNFELAYRAIGLAHYKEEQYREAMKYFRLARDKGHYSLAFKEYRKEFVREHFNWFFGGAIAAYVLLRHVLPRLLRLLRRRLLGHRRPEADGAQRGRGK